MRDRLISALGILVMMALAYALCPKDRRRAVSLRTIGWGLVVLVAFAVLVLRTPVNRAFVWANDLVEGLLGFSRKGAEFVFGSLVSDPKSFGFIFAFQVLPTILFFSSLMAVLYHLRIMPLVIRKTAHLLARFLGTSGAETFSTVADVFVGQTEAPLVVRPYVNDMTKSELMAIMTGGFATVAGGEERLAFVRLAGAARLRVPVRQLLGCSGVSGMPGAGSAPGAQSCERQGLQ